MSRHLKARTRESISGLGVFDLTPQLMEKSQDEIWEYSKGLDKTNDLNEILIRAVACIHAIPRLFDKKERIHLEHCLIYFGICKTTQIYNRFKQHSENNKHYAMIIGKTSGAKAAVYESAAINIVKALEARSALCCGGIKNIKNASRSLDGDCFLYLSFNIDRKCVDFGNIESSEDFSDLVGKIRFDFEDRNISLDRGNIIKFLKVVRARTKEEKLYWARSCR